MKERKQTKVETGGKDFKASAEEMGQRVWGGSTPENTKKFEELRERFLADFKCTSLNKRKK